jgi:uncharacterized protein YeaO (DUF488 family)
MSKHQVKIKRVYDPPAEEDGQRVLVDRLWPRGLKRAEARVDVWLREVAPSDALRRWYGHEVARWEAFAARYRAELADEAHRQALAQLREMAGRGPLTLLFAAQDAAHSNAELLRQMLAEE